MNIDQDCFITDKAVLAELIADFKSGGYTHAGISDGGCLSGRNNISWAVMNPFFNLFAPSAIQRLELPTPFVSDIRDFGFRPDFNARKPDFISEYETSMWEPFNGFFNWLFEYGRPLWLHGELHTDGISTIIKYKDKPFALHSWYSRDYDYSTDQRKRIDKLYLESLRIRVT